MLRVMLILMWCCDFVIDVAVYICVRVVLPFAVVNGVAICHVVVSLFMWRLLTVTSYAR